VCKVLLVCKVQQVQPEKEFQACQVTLVQLVSQELQVNLVAMASQVQKVIPVLVILAQPDILVAMVPQDLQAITVFQEKMVHLVPPAHQELVTLAPQVTLA